MESFRLQPCIGPLQDITEPRRGERLRQVTRCSVANFVTDRDRWQQVGSFVQQRLAVSRRPGLLAAR